MTELANAVLANAIKKKFNEEWNAIHLRRAKAALIKAISNGDEYEINEAQKRVDRMINNTEPVLSLIEYTGKDSNGHSIVPEPGRDTWGNVMLRPYVRPIQNDWAKEAMILINWMSPEDLAFHVNNKGGYALHGKGPWLGMTALHWAVQIGFPSVVDALLKIPEIDVNSHDESGRTPLQLAFTGWSYNVMVVTALIEHGADFSACDRKGNTPLHIAILFNKETETEWLPLMIMEHITNFDYNKKYKNGKTLLQTAQSWDTPDSIIEKIKSLM